MESNNEDKPLIIIRKVKRSGHGGHHGGSWKIAYADFITSMMAFFLLLWLLNAIPAPKLKALATYFSPSIGLPFHAGDIKFEQGPRDPSNKISYSTKFTNPVFGTNSAGSILQMPNNVRSSLEKLDSKNFSSMEHDLYKAIHDNPNLSGMDNMLMIDETPEGLRIQLLDQEKRPLFIPGTAIIEPYTKDLLKVIAGYIRYMPNYVSIDGHTNHDLRPTNIDNWQLSVSRSLATRTYFLQDCNINTDQVLRVAGYADQEPIDPANPAALENIRISLILLRNTVVPFTKQIAPNSLLFPNNGNNSSADSDQQ